MTTQMDRRCRAGIGRRPTSRSPSCSNAGCPGRSRRPDSARRAGTPVLRVSVSGAGRRRLGAGARRLGAARSPLRGGRRPTSGFGSPPRTCAWRSATPIPDLPEIVPAGWSARHILIVDPADVDLVKQVSGRILIEIEGRRRRRFALDVGFGKAGVSAGRPRTTVRLDGADLRGVAKRRDSADAASRRRAAEDRRRSRAGDAATVAGREPSRTAVTAPACRRRAVFRRRAPARPPGTAPGPPRRGGRRPLGRRRRGDRAPRVRSVRSLVVLGGGRLRGQRVPCGREAMGEGPIVGRYR